MLSTWKISPKFDLGSWLKVEFFPEPGAIHSQRCSSRRKQSKSAVSQACSLNCYKMFSFRIAFKTRQCRFEHSLQIWPVCVSACLEEARKIISIFFSVSLQFYYSEKIWCICSVHDLAFWYADAQPCISSQISVATAFTNYVTMYNLLSENQIRLKLGLSPKNKILQSICLLCQHSNSFLLHTLQGKEVENNTLASRNRFLSHGGWLRWVSLIGVA